ncbi:hypothetical protein [Chamaesiphon sp. OTE_75_metabat_556]|nr:hypothetical protein [Chamaesiphon sp. OTE_75_metabat_556]
MTDSSCSDGQTICTQNLSRSIAIAHPKIAATSLRTIDLCDCWQNHLATK